MSLLDIWGERFVVSGLWSDKREDGTRIRVTANGRVTDQIERLPLRVMPCWLLYGEEGTDVARAYFHAAIAEASYYPHPDETIILLMITTKIWWRHYDGARQAAGKQYRAVSGELV